MRKPKLRSSYSKWDLDAERNIVPIGIFIIKVDPLNKEHT
jgi:hypothetical protein